MDGKFDSDILSLSCRGLNSEKLSLQCCVVPHCGHRVRDLVVLGSFRQLLLSSLRIFTRISCFRVGVPNINGIHICNGNLYLFVDRIRFDGSW